MPNPDYTYNEYMLDLAQSIAFDKEEFLEAAVASTGLTPEVFSRDYRLIEEPVNVIRTDDFINLEKRFEIKQIFRIVAKTNEERQLEIESKENKDDSSKPE